MVSLWHGLGNTQDYRLWPDQDQAAAWPRGEGPPGRLPRRIVSQQPFKQPDLPRMEHLMLAAPVQRCELGLGQAMRLLRPFVQFGVRQPLELFEGALVDPVEHVANLGGTRIEARIG